MEMIGLQATLPSRWGRSDSVTRSQSARLEHKSVQQTAMQQDPVLPAHISAAHGQMKHRDVTGQDNMQDYMTWFRASGCVGTFVFSIVS